MALQRALYGNPIFQQSPPAVFILKTDPMYMASACEQLNWRQRRDGSLNAAA